MNERYLRRENEDIIDYEIRLASIKKEEKPDDLDWEDIKNLIGYDGNKDSLRKANDSIFGGLNIAKYYQNKNKEPKKFDKSVMFINDVHAPYERTDLLDIIRKHRDEIDTLVIGGDFLDCHSISSFNKIDTFSLKDEVVYGYNLLKKIRTVLNNGQKIIMIKGNHEDRYYKNICKMNEKDLQTFINPELLEMYTEGFKLYIDGKKKVFEPIEGLIYIPHWYAIIDGIIVCHPLTFSQCKGKMLENVAQHFINKKIDFDLAVMAHTHKYSAGCVERFAGKYIIENGCMAHAQSYSDTGKTAYAPQSYCYTIVKYNKGEKISLNNCRTYMLDPEKEEKEDCKKYSIEL